MLIAVPSPSSRNTGSSARYAVSGVRLISDARRDLDFSQLDVAVRPVYNTVISTGLICVPKGCEFVTYGPAVLDSLDNACNDSWPYQLQALIGEYSRHTFKLLIQF
jgi:hypothetical protein